MLSFRPLKVLRYVAGMALTAFAIVVGGVLPAIAKEIGVTVKNTSEPVLCAEKDNVTLTFASKAVRKFRIEAVHPAYLAALSQDNWAADWTACEDIAPKPVKAGVVQSGDAAATPVTERVTLYEEPGQWLVGWRFPEFWRDAGTSVRVGDRVEKGLHLVQLWKIRPNGGEEILVFYPQDGYWRARPRGPRGRDLTAFGSSFLIGPVEIDQRPVVNLSEVKFDPKGEAFTLSFKRGGSATLRLAELSDARLTLDIEFSGLIEGLPFAALRSMYITETNNDVARVAVREAGAVGRAEAGILSYKGGVVHDLWAGRMVPSRHNTSAPDMLFKAFDDGTTR
ncbi:MAG TPA: hypothetical protein VMX97_02875 [Hyphomicrobiaceae bacterium]|nr:hypothetical protein [Hyphomicrobiaceae bacterium]